MTTISISWDTNFLHDLLDLISAHIFVFWG